MGTAPNWLRRLDAGGVPLLLARLFVGGMFAWLAYRKLLDPFEFLKQLHAYGVIPAQPPVAINTIAAVLPWLELVCAAALLLGVGLRGAAAVVSGMLLCFTPLLLGRAWSIYQGGQAASFCAVHFDCGCGTGEVYICAKLAENLALQFAALIPLLSASRRFCLAALWTRSRAAGGRRPLTPGLTPRG